MNGWIIDKSALACVAAHDQAQEWSHRIQRGLVHISLPTLLEIGYSALTGADWHKRVETPPVGLMPVLNLTPTIEARALEVQGLLAQSGHHRAPGVANLVIAATGELHGVTVLHCDKDFELIAEITRQPVERLV